MGETPATAKEIRTNIMYSNSHLKRSWVEVNLE